MFFDPKITEKDQPEHRLAYFDLITKRREVNYKLILGIGGIVVTWLGIDKVSPEDVVSYLNDFGVPKALWVMASLMNLV